MTIPTHQQCLEFLRLSNDVGRRAMHMGHHPFGAVLVAPDQKTVLLTQCNIDTVNHAESTLARIAASNYPAEYLWQCTLYTAVEPCCMCSGTIYWANIGRVVYGMTEANLLQCTGNHSENPTMSVSAQYVFEHGQKNIELIGPIVEIEQETIQLQKEFWSTR
ncbi:nucleoside deaminase [Acinetobacter shaoyimingii]|uniref:Nucleoside deaminase n=1 Tax=Acinetobacter shaoyimingii TaxID=2715164 RepID=A0A6G8RUR5_9GAMM|nr:nucleoside deaminase [Acinetobacter shaoyimingii]NHB58497.1 nucleoside deaminase [Acinetobacter shaoyimingii]QIO05631.1 nucleoside deaminase [Acinetobacter shaoyimingii]